MAVYAEDRIYHRYKSMDITNALLHKQMAPCCLWPSLLKSLSYAWTGHIHASLIKNTFMWTPNDQYLLYSTSVHLSSFIWLKKTNSRGMLCQWCSAFSVIACDVFNLIVLEKSCANNHHIVINNDIDCDIVSMEWRTGHQVHSHTKKGYWLCTGLKVVHRHGQAFNGGWNRQFWDKEFGHSG